MSEESTSQELNDDLSLPPKIYLDIQELEALVSNIDQENLTDSNHVLKIDDVARELADQFRDLSFRGTVGSKTQIIPNIVRATKKIVSLISNEGDLLAIQPIRLLRQLLRIIGNLVHTADRNRRQYLDADGAQALKLAMEKFMTLERLADGFCQEEIQISILVATNLSLDYQPAIVALAEIGFPALLSDFIKYAYSKRLEWISLPLILMDELVSVEAGWTQIPESLLNTLAQMIIYYAGEVDISNFGQSETDPNLQLLAMSSHLLDSIVEHASLFRFTEWLFIDGDRHFGTFYDGLPVPVWLRLSMFLKSHSDLHTACSTNHLTSLFITTKAQIIRSIVVAVAYSGLSLQTSLEMMDMLVDWIRDPKVLDNREDLVIMIGLWLGNLACDEESCRFLIEDCQILDPLIKIFRKWAPSSFESESDSTLVKKKPGQQAQVLHAWCGLSRNLAVADTYKSKLGELGLVTYALECFRPEFDIVEPLNGTASALLRHLCRNHVENVKRVLETNRISSVVNLAGRAEQPYLMLESARLLSVLTNTANRFDSSPSDAIDNELKILYSETTVEALVRFAYVCVTSHQLVLINEALISLALLAVRPELAHSICSSLVKVRDSITSSTSASEALLSINEENQGQKSTEKKKNKYRNALEALLSIWIPSSDADGKSLNELKKEDNAPDKVLEGDMVLENDAEACDILKLLESKAATRVEDDQNEDSSLIYPIQIKENLKVVLIQLGKKSIKNKTNSTDNKINVNHNGKDFVNDLAHEVKEEDIQKIQTTLVNHCNLLHLKKPPLDLDQQTKASKTCHQQNQKQQRVDGLEKSKMTNGDAVDEICCKTVDLNVTNGDNKEGHENGSGVYKQSSSTFSIIEVLQAWDIVP